MLWEAVDVCGVEQLNHAGKLVVPGVEVDVAMQGIGQYTQHALWVVEVVHLLQKSLLWCIVLL